MDIKFLREHAKVPEKGSLLAAGYDLYAAMEDDTLPNGNKAPGCIQIAPHETRMIPTGFAIAIPNGYFGGIFARSGLATKQGLRPANCVGVIDSDYRGEVMVALHNDSDSYKYIYRGDRIAQLIFLPVCDPVPGFQIVEELDTTLRGEGGFGSTGSN